MKQLRYGAEMHDKRTIQPAWGALFVALLLFAGTSVRAETAAGDISVEDAEVTVEPIELLPAAELEELVGPIALYPDDLLSIVLAASTYPLQVVQASRFLLEREQNSQLKPDEEWDDSVVALLNYPEALALLNDDLDWTWKLGEAMLAQQEDVLSAVGEFRERARVAGNLESDERQVVEVIDDGAIEIKPVDPEIIYVPYYEPSRVTVYHDYPVYHYYPRPYPVYYYPYPAGHHFSAGYFWGVTSAFSIGWSSHRLHMHHHSFYGHPYYGRTYYDRYYYRRPHLSLTYNYYRNYNHYRHSNRRYHAGNYWQPRSRYYGSSPRYARRSANRLAYRDGRRRDGYRRDGNRHYRHDRRDHYDGDKRRDRGDARRDHRRGDADRTPRERDSRRGDRQRQSLVAGAGSRGGDLDGRRRDGKQRLAAQVPQRRAAPAVQRGTTQAPRRAAPERRAARESGGRVATPSRDARTRNPRRTASAQTPPRPQLESLRTLTQGNVPTLARQRPAASRSSGTAPRRIREASDTRRSVSPANGGQARALQQARSAAARVHRPVPQRTQRSAPPRGERRVAKQARSAPAQVRRGTSMQARVQRQAQAYAQKPARAQRQAPAARAQRPQSAARSASRSAPRSAPNARSTSRGSGQRGAPARRSSGKGSGKRMSFARH